MFQLLLQFFQEMFGTTKPFTNPKTNKIIATSGRLPIEKLSMRLKQKIYKINGIFVETISLLNGLLFLLMATKE